MRQAVKDIGINYPVAVDSDYRIWRAFKNEYRPTLYFVDSQGRVRRRKFGEGEYEQSEAAIQQLLAETGRRGGEQEPVSVDVYGAEASADWGNLRSSENYVDYDRTENFASPGGALLGRSRMYSAPARLKLNHWALVGPWTMNREAVVLDQPGGRIRHCFHARDLHLVMGPVTPGISVRYRVRMDGQPPNAAHGVDADDRGQGLVSEPRMYQLVRQSKPISDRQFEIEFLDPGVEAYCFTFG